jgi:hypothetical protein
MTKPIEPTIPAEGASEHGFTREKLVRLQEYIRKNGVPLDSIARFVIKNTCVECQLHNGHRKVLSYGT